MPDPDPNKTVFISYRRNVSSFIARAIFGDLREHGYDVFMDVESIDSGTFDTIILNQIVARAHFLIICTPGTFENCDQPSDLLRREIETAMDRQRNIVPVLANGFSFQADEHYLTGRLADLHRLNGLPLVHEYFEEGLARLRDRYLKQPVAGAILPAPQVDQAAVEQKIGYAAAQPAPTTDELSAEEYFSRALARPSDDLEGKVADYGEAIRLNPGYAHAYSNRGYVRDDQGDTDGAIADYSEAIRIDPNYGLAYNNRGLARFQKGDLDGAIADFSETIRLDPNDADVFNNRGLTRAKRGDQDGAIADFTEAIRLNPNFAWAYNNRGHACINQGDMEGALVDIEAAQWLDPDLKTARAEQAICLYSLGRVSEAQSIWRILVDTYARYRDPDWVGKELHWRPELVEAARTLIASLVSE